MTEHEDGSVTLTSVEKDFIFQTAINHYHNNFKQSLSALKERETIPCPTCHRKIGTYLNTITIGHVLLLERLYELCKERRIKKSEFVYVHRNELEDYVKENFGKTPNDFTSKLSKHNLIKKKAELKNDGNSSGYWTITRDGAKFLDGKLRIPKWILYQSDDLVLEVSKELIGVEDITKDFNYNELLNKTNV